MSNFKKGDTIQLKSPYKGFLSEGGSVLEIMHDYIVFKLKFQRGKEIIAKASFKTMQHYFYNQNAGLQATQNYLNQQPAQMALNGIPLKQGSTVFYTNLKEFPQDFYLEQDISDFKVFF